MTRALSLQRRSPSSAETQRFHSLALRLTQSTQIASIFRNLRAWSIHWDWGNYHMTSTLIRASAALALLLSTSACATVTRGTNTAFEVQTTPAGATVSTSNGHQCPSTPCSMKMPRKSEFDVTISKPGYQTVRASVTNRVAGGGAAGMAGNVLVGGIIGAGVDVATGSMLDLTPNPLVVDMEPAGGASVISRDSPTS